MSNFDVDRFEIKYLIDNQTMVAIQSDLNGLVIADKNALNGRGYKVSSVYFDDSQQSSYFEKLAGVLKRSKFRARYYNDNLSSIKFEEKQRLNNRIRKLSQKITHSQLEASASGRDMGVESEFQSNFDKLRYTHGIRPVARINYNRAPYTCVQNPKIRVTFDTNITVQKTTQSGDFGPLIRIFPENVIVLEFKFNGKMPFWMGFIAQKYELKETTCSKYALGIETLQNLGMITLYE
jgi:hypothetical protein